MKEVHLAIDFGGGSGRVIAGYLSGNEIILDTIHRFRNRQIILGKHVYWDFLSLFEDMKQGIRMANEKGYHIRSIGIDTWGVDFGLIDKNGNLLGNPVCYRDSRTNGVPDEVFGIIDRSEHYGKTGTQVMPINTLFQLYAMKKENSRLFELADKLLFMPDLFSYYLTGVANNEYTIASTSEMLDAEKRDWDMQLIEKLGLPKHLFCDIAMPGESRGMLKPEIKEELGIDYDVEVFAVASHDTASAAYAITGNSDTSNKAFISSGTWSLLGIMTDKPILTEKARIAEFTNEGGAENKYCFIQNITGLWFVQKLIELWKEQGKDTAYDILIPAAEKAEINTIIDVDAPIFQSPRNMEKAIDQYCMENGPQKPESQGEYMRCVLLSLAERYRKGINELNSMLEHPVECLHIIGGGSQNNLLNRLTEEATGLKVLTGPVEATAIGNIKLQIKAMSK